jgi:hypothetical protein
MCIMLLMRAAYITLASERGWALEILTGGPQVSSMPFYRAQKKAQFPGPNPLPRALVMDVARIKSIMHVAI